MAGGAARVDLPVGDPAARDGRPVAALAHDQLFVFQGDVRPFAGGDEVGARGLQRRAGGLLVAGQHDLDVGVAQGAGGVHRAQRRDDDDHAALVVGNAGPGRGIAGALEALERRVRLEHGVEVADHQHALAAPVAAVGGDQVAGAPGGAHVDPFDLEAQRFQLGADHVADRLDPGQVERAGILVDQAFQQRDGVRLVGLDRIAQALVAGGRGGRQGGGHAQGEQQAAGQRAGSGHRSGSGTVGADHNPAATARRA